ncbi:hypothetical protein ACJJTC_019300 [Scirpophaga incertulas]
MWPDLINCLTGSNEDHAVPSTSSQFVSPAKVSIGVSTKQSPRKPFRELSSRQKKRRAESFHMSSEEIKYAYCAQLKTEGNEEIAEILEHLFKNPQDVKNVKRCIFAKDTKPAFSSDEALGLFLSLKLTKRQYNILRKCVNEKDSNASIFPSYYQVQQAKLECYPSKDATTVTESSAKVKLQALLDITTKRIIAPLVFDSDFKELTLISKWGFDGASNQAIYKQISSKYTMKLQKVNLMIHSFRILMGSLVPIRLLRYRLTIQTWTVKGDSKCIMESRKKTLQEAFNNRIGLLIDIVKQGHGSTNDGNTARRFFANPNLTAEITGVSEDLIRRFAIILEAISSGNHIDTVKFHEYAQATMQLYLDLYSWYYMPSSVHKVLMHGAAIIESFGLIPIGQLSEEAAEARNKEARKKREE